MTKTDSSEPPRGMSTEERILTAAEKEFMQKGYAGARTTTIAEAAGVTHAMLHYYFRTKDKLFEKIIDQKILLLRDIILESVGVPEMDLFEKIRSVIRSHLDFIACNPDLPRFMIGEIFSHPDRMEMVLRHLQKYAPLVVTQLQKQIDDYAAEGRCRRVDAGMLMLDILSLNVFPFMASPMVHPLLGWRVDDSEFVEARKKENVETIMRKLLP